MSMYIDDPSKAGFCANCDAPKAAHDHTNYCPDSLCDCEFDPYDESEEKSWHYKRTCASCGHVWWSLHCPHETAQGVCSECGVRPSPVGWKFTRSFHCAHCGQEFGSSGETLRHAIERHTGGTTPNDGGGFRL